MVNWILPASTSPPIDGLMFKSQSTDSDMSQSPSFGEILKAKAKKEQKALEDNALPAAAALAAVVHTSPADIRQVSAQSGAGSKLGAVSDRSERTAEARETAALHSSKAADQSQPGTDPAAEVSDQKTAELRAAKSASVAAPAVGTDQAAAAIEAPVAEAVLPAVSGQTVQQSSTAAQSAQNVAVSAAPVIDPNLTGLQAAQAALSVGADPALESVDAQGNIPSDGNKKLESTPTLSGENPDASQIAAATVTQVSSKPADAAVPANLPPKVQATPEDLKANSTNNTEKALPVESQPEVNPALASLTAPTSRARENTDALKVAAGVSTPLANTQAGDVVQQIMRQMSVTLQSGPTSMRLQLNPKELGAIDVQMVKNAQGVSVTFFAEQASTGRLLETQMNQLRQSLIDSGVQLSSLNIGQHGQPGQQGGSFRQASQFAEYAKRDTAQSETETEIDTRLRPERNAGQLLGVDYRV